ncbi:MAG: VCBS repeat-containing protein [Patescibacteria group bacterium]
MKNLNVNRKIALGFGSALVMCVFFFTAHAASADVQIQVEPDERISSVSFTPTSTAAGATTNYTVSFTLDQTLSPGGFINFNFDGAGKCDMDWSLCLPNFENATLVSGLPGGQFDIYGQSFGVRAEPFTAGTYTLVLSGVRNPIQLMSHYRVAASSQAFGEEPPPEGERAPSTPSDPYFFAPVAVKGAITDPSNEPAGRLGVGFYTADYSYNGNTNTDDYGFYSIPKSGFPTGEVFMSIYLNPDYGDYVAPDPVALTYAGTTITLDSQLKVAKKKVNGTVRYNTGQLVTTGAEVNANKQGGGGGKNASVGADGTFEIFLSGGTWEIRPNCGWDQETQQQRVCNWTYNGQGELVQFADNDTTETKNVTLTVTKTDAIVKGRVKLPNGNWMNGGGVNLQQGQGQGMGTGINNDGRFLANVTAGTYQLTINADNQNPDMARYYLPTMTVTVTTDQTLDLGTLTMQQKTSRITGKVTLVDSGDPVEGLRLNCWTRNGSGWGQTTTVADGSFTIWLAPGQYECRPDDRNTEYIMPQTGPSELYDLSANETISGVNFEVQRADAQISVRLVDTDGNAITNIYGWAYARKKGANGGSNFGSGIDRGTATIALLGGQTYVVGAQVPTDNANVVLLREEVEVTLDEGESANVALVMERPDARIRGFLKDQNGKAIKGADAEVYAVVGGDNKGGGGVWLGTRVNQADGSFSLSVKGGVKYVMGYNFPNMGSGSGDFLNSPPNMDPFTVPVDGTVTKVLTAFRATAHVKVSLLDPDGKAVKFGWAWCSNRKEMENKVEAESTMVDTGGEIRNGQGQVNVIAGTFECGAGIDQSTNTNWMPPDMQEVTLVDGDTKTITLQFGKADATIKGTAVYENGQKVSWGFCHAFTFSGKFSGGEVINGKFNIPVNKGESWQIGCDSDNNRKMSRSDEQVVSVYQEGDIEVGELTLIEKNWAMPEGFTTQFDAGTQLSLTLPDGTTLRASPGAFGPEGDTMTLVASPNIKLYFDQNNKPLNFAWNFEMTGADGALVESFNSAVSVCIPYSQDVVDEQELDENNLIAKYYNATTGTWELPEGTTQDTTANVICFQSTHFTNFALVAGANILGGLGTAQNDILVTPLSNGGPQVIVADENGKTVTNFFAYSSSLRIGIQAVTADVDGDGEVEIITAPGAGAGPQIRIFNKAGQVEGQFWAYDSGLRMGVNLSVIDDDNDGVYDIVAAPMAGGGPQVKIFNSRGEMKRQYFAYAETFRGGVELAVADVNGDGAQEVVVAPESAAGPQVRVLKSDGTLLSQFFAYASNVRGGFNLTLGDVNSDGVYDIVVSPKAGLGPQVASFDGNGNLLGRFFAYAETFRGGIYASGGDVDGDGNLEIVVTPESNAGPQVRVFEVDGTVLSQFWAYASTLRGNFTSFVADLNGDGTTEIVTAPGTGMGPQVRTFNQDGQALSQFFSHHPGFRGGITISPAI